MEIRMKYKDGKANVMIINDPIEHIVDLNTAVSECLAELYRVLNNQTNEEK